MNPRPALVSLALALLALVPASVDAAARRASARSPARPDAALYHEAQGAEARLRASPKRQTKRAEWEAVGVRYRRVVARFPRSGYCDNALLSIGNLYREMAGRFHSNQYREEALSAYR